MTVSTDATFWEMFRELPVRTALATVVPVLLVIAQLLNGYVHGVPMVRVAGFAAGLLMATVLVTQSHLVTFQRKRLQRDLFGDDERP